MRIQASAIWKIAKPTARFLLNIGRVGHRNPRSMAVIIHRIILEILRHCETLCGFGRCVLV